MIADDGNWTLKTLRERGPTLTLWRDYYEGRHRLAFATDKFRQAFGGMFRAFADNLCAIPVDAVAERVRIVGWGIAEGEGAIRDDAAKSAAAMWSMFQLSMVANEVHREALQVGDAYVVLWPNPEGVPVWHVNIAEEVAVRYDPERPGRITFAGKAWTDDAGRGRLTLYYPDRLERYATRDKLQNGMPATVETFAEVADEPVVENPYGVVPVFHFPNRANVGRQGVAEHRHAIPIQDALNKTVLDTLVGGEFMALPQRWAAGLDVPEDPVTGQKVAPVPGPGQLWSTDDPATRFGQFAAADLRQLLDVARDHRAEIARVTGTPPHRLMMEGDGAWPSGEALRTAEGPLTAKIEDREDVWGSVWGWAMGLALRMTRDPVDRPLRPIWRDPTPRSPSEDAAVAESKRRAGVSQRQVLREFGYTEDEVDRIMDEDRDERAMALDRGLA